LVLGSMARRQAGIWLLKDEKQNGDDRRKREVEKGVWYRFNDESLGSQDG